MLGHSIHRPVASSSSSGCYAGIRMGRRHIIVAQHLSSSSPCCSAAPSTSYAPAAAPSRHLARLRLAPLAAKQQSKQGGPAQQQQQGKGKAAQPPPLKEEEEEDEADVMFDEDEDILGEWGEGEGEEGEEEDGFYDDEEEGEEGGDVLSTGDDELLGLEFEEAGPGEVRSGVLSTRLHASDRGTERLSHMTTTAY